MFVLEISVQRGFASLQEHQHIVFVLGQFLFGLSAANFEDALIWRSMICQEFRIPWQFSLGNMVENPLGKVIWVVADMLTSMCFTTPPKSKTSPMMARKNINKPHHHF
jgi:hypothetical protein